MLANMHTDRPPDGHATRRFELVLDLVGCRREVVENPELLEMLSIGLWTAAVGTPAPKAVATRLALPLDGHTVTLMAGGSTITGRFEPSADRAQIRVSSTELVDVSGAESFVQEILRPRELTTG